jgi:hypothetical protein
MMRASSHAFPSFVVVKSRGLPPEGQKQIQRRGQVESKTRVSSLIDLLAGMKQRDHMLLLAVGDALAARKK